MRECYRLVWRSELEGVVEREGKVGVAEGEGHWCGCTVREKAGSAGGVEVECGVVEVWHVVKSICKMLLKLRLKLSFLDGTCSTKLGSCLVKPVLAL